MPTASRAAAGIRQALIALDARWGEPDYWQAIAKNGSRWTPDYLLAAVDLKRDAQGNDRARRRRRSAPSATSSAAPSRSAPVVTLCCLLLGYPLAYWLSTLTERQANLLMILVLLPFWTSILVRIAAWIVLLQSDGLVNRALMSLGLTTQPLALLFNRLGVIISMVHILLPFMILPLYSVMKSVPPTYLRAAVSLGSPPLAAFLRVYVPQTYPGVGAGGLLVFILAHRLLRHAGPAGRRRRPDAELLRRPVHQRRRQLGHGLRARRAAAGRHAGAVRGLPPFCQSRTEPGMGTRP